MSKLLLVVALVCAVAYAQADAGIVSVTRFANADCTSAITGGQTNYTTGVCSAFGGYASSYYFDASNVYFVSFTGSNCTMDAILAIQQYPTGCAKVAYATSYTTYGTSATSVFGSTFPPSGFIATTSYKNVTSDTAKATVCTAGNGQVQLQSAQPFGKCTVRPTGKLITSPSSTNVFCSTDGNTFGQVTFSDATCGVSATALEAPVPTGCTIEGSVATAPFTCGSTATFPSDIPATYYATYSDSGCKTLVSTTYISDSCFDSQKLVCGSVNGTDGYATFSQWNTIPSGAVDGSCSGDAQISQSVVAGTCVPFPKDSTTNFRKYGCSGTGPSASASTASVSIIATLFAAVAAVFAVRSL